MSNRFFHPLIYVFEIFPIAFSALFPLINPLGSAIIFLGLVGPADGVVYKRLARKIAWLTLLFLIVVDLVGSLVLAFFGISLPVIQVAGGLVLASMGWKLLNSPDQPQQSSTSQPPTSLKELDARAFYPYTFPVTAGPATVVVTLTLAAHVQEHVLIDTLFSQLGLFLAIAFLCVLVYFAYAYAPQLARKISPHTVHGVLRIISFILLAIGVQIFWGGAAELLHQAFPR